MVYFAVDAHGSNLHVNTLANEDDNVNDIESDDDRLYDEQQHSRSLFASMPSPSVVRLRKRARVLCTVRVGNCKKIVPGSIGEVIGFLHSGVNDSLLAGRDLGWDMTGRMQLYIG